MVSVEPAQWPVPHNDKPSSYKGGGWCDCQHKLTLERMQELKPKEKNDE